VSTVEINGASRHFGHVHTVNDLSFTPVGGSATFAGRELE
jgi:hypothetical protein